MIEKRQAPDWDRANHLMATEIEPALTRLADQLATQVTHTRAEVDKMAGRWRPPVRPFTAPLLLATTSVILLGTLVALLFSRRLTRDIASLVKRAGLVADGRLPVTPLPVLRQDELGGLTGSINRMSAQLRELVGRSGGAVGQVEGAGREVGQTTNAIVDDLASQNQRLDAVAAAIEQMSVSTRDVAGNIADAAGAARQTEQQAREGSRPRPHGDHHGADWCHDCPGKPGDDAAQQPERAGGEGHRSDRHHRRADQSAGTQCGHRGGAGR